MLKSIYFNFNSIKVRLELPKVGDESVDLSYFNSIKVRLERFSQCLKGFSDTFQFHKGAIRTFIAYG